MQKLKRSWRRVSANAVPWAGKHKAEIAAVITVVLIVGVSAASAAKRPPRKPVVRGVEGATKQSKHSNQSPKPNTTKPGSAQVGRGSAAPVNISELQQRHYEQRYDMLKTRLDAGVKSRTLSKQQADLLAKKLDEMKAYRLSLLSKPTVERSKLLSAKRKELRQWVLENKIPPQYGLTLL